MMINYGAGGPADIEARLFARHIGRHIEGSPRVIVQNIDGAGGLIGTTYLGEIAPKDGTVMGHLTGMPGAGPMMRSASASISRAMSSLDISAARRSISCALTYAPGMQQATDIVKVKGLISGGLGPDNAKDLLIRLGLEMLGIPHRHVTSYRSSATARLALQQGEINFYSESPPSYRASCIPASSRRLAIPVWHDPRTRRTAGASKQVSVLGIDAVSRTLQNGEGRAAVRDIVGRFQYHPHHQWLDAAHRRAAAGRAAAAVAALQRRRRAIDEDKAYAEDAIKVIGFVPEYSTGPATNREVREGLSVRPGDQGVHCRLREKSRQVVAPPSLRQRQ